jgi:hypothetical protein
MSETPVSCDFAPATFSFELKNTPPETYFYLLICIEKKTRTQPRWCQGGMYCFCHLDVCGTGDRFYITRVSLS